VTGTPLPSLSHRIDTVTRLDPTAPAIEFEGAWRSWGQVAQTVAGVADEVTVGDRVGVILRNRPAQVGLLLGVLRAGGCAVAINPGRGHDRAREDIASLGLPLVAGGTADLDDLVQQDGTTTLGTSDLGQGVTVTSGHRPRGPRDRRPGVAVEMLTSGTTGPPKRVELSYDTLERVLIGAKYYETNRDTAPRLRKGVAIVNSPLVHLGGLFRVLQCVSDGRAFALLERFTVEAWRDAVARHRPATVSLVPTALRMVLDADIDPAALGSVRSVVCGTAPLAADDADAFTAKYGIPVLSTYAATEFGGSVAGWNLEDYTRFWTAKRGSVGRAHEGCELRVVDPESGEQQSGDVEGLLEVKAAQLGRDVEWIRTTDIARIDADGFVWILGRADQAIIRGGFKVRPDEVRVALESHPGVRGAAVIGAPDARLGAVPVAVVEPRSEYASGGVTEPELLAHAEARLARYELPTRVLFVAELPRTESGKVDLMAVRELVDRSVTATE